MRSRTLNRPGLEWFERDLSQFTDEVGGTTSLVIGFSEQGKSKHIYDTITSVDTLKRVIGTPKTEAERYSYYAAKKILDQRGRLIFFRIPYANEMEKLVPATVYAIDEGTTDAYTKDTAYIPTKLVTSSIHENLANIGLTSLTEIKEQLTVTTTKDSSGNEVFPGFSTVTKLLWKNADGTFDSTKDIELKSDWTSTSTYSDARFVVLVDSAETKSVGAGTGKCSANEDSRFNVVTNIIDKEFALTDLIKSDGKDFRDIDRTTDASKAALDALVLAALHKEDGFEDGVITEGPTYTYTVTGVDDSKTEFKQFKDISGLKDVDQAEGKLLTTGFNNGFYPTKIVVKVQAFATYKCKKTASATEVYDSTELSKSAQYIDGTTLTISSNTQEWKKYLRATSGDLSTASLFIENLINTSEIKGVDGIFGKGYAPDELKLVDRIVRIHRTDKNGYVDAGVVDELRDGNYENIGKILTKKGFVIVNSSNKVLGRDKYNNDGNEVLGVVPFVFTGFNKLAASRLITPDKTHGNTSIYQAVQGFDVGASGDVKQDILSTDGFVKAPFTIGSFDIGSDTISNTVAAYMPTLIAGEGGKLPGSEMNQTAVLVAELSVDPNYDNKVVVTARELFYGNWDSGSSLYLPNLINENSEYIELFTNYTPTEKYVKDLETMITVVTPACDSNALSNFWFLNPTDAAVLGFREYQITKLIKYEYLTDTLDSAYNQLGNIDETEIDVVVDGGLTSIANLCVRAMGGSDNATGTKYNTKADSDSDEYYVPTLLKGGDINGVNAVAVWKTVAAKLNSFCEVTRKDCIAYIDAPRNLTVNYNAPVVKKGGSKTVDMDVLPKLKYLTGLNSTYGSMNTTWVRLVDDFTGAQFWCPPSVLKAEKTVWADKTYGYPWYVATGTERGTLSDAIEASLIVQPAQEDIIYSTGFNYIKSFKNDGIVIWGQKTLQSSANQSMLGRENVRRMFLYAERKCYKAVKKFLFRPITTALMNNVVDTLTPIMQDIQDHEGCYDYVVKCDSDLNTPTSIMRNELRCTVAIHPTPLAEYIILGFLCVGLNVTITEELITANS